MKQIYSYLILLMSVFLFPNSAWGQLTSSGEWTATTISGNTTINLDGDVTITGRITITNGGTLTINGYGKTITAFTGDGNTERTSFFVEAGGILEINKAIVTGGNTGSIGGTVGENDVQDYPGFTKSGRFISLNNTAKVYLTEVTAQYLYSINKDVVPFVQLSGTEDGTSKTNRGLLKMDRCTVQHCLNRVDNGIIHQSGGYMHADIDIDGSTITNCVILANNTGTGYGGVIKGAGSTDCNLTMDYSTMQYCWSSGWGGAVLWAASGGGCKAVFNNCTFQFNYARYLGGAISSESTVELKECILQNNKAGYGGGALAAFPFTLTQTADVADNSTAIGLKLENNLIQKNETLYSTNYNGANVTNKIRAKESDGTEQGVYSQSKGYFNPRYTLLNATDIYYPTGGGGIWVLMNKDGWNCNLNIGSNQIINNKSANDAGGVLLYKQTPYRLAVSGDAEYVANAERALILGDYTVVDGERTGITTMTISAQVNNNNAENSGGGIAIGASNNNSASWTFPDVIVSGGEISGNTSSICGGGLYMPGGNLTVDAGKTMTIDGNSAVNGGAIYLDKGNITVKGTLNAGITTANNASNNGGAVYLANGNLTLNQGTLSNNVASSNGGAVYLANGNLTLNQGTLSNNVASSNGGAVYMEKGEFIVSGKLTASRNQAKEGKGGAIYCMGKFTVNGDSDIQYNLAEDGAGVYVTGQGNNVVFSKTTQLSNNSSTGNGGAVYVNGGGSINVTGDSFSLSNNNAKNGGALYVDGGDITTTSCRKATITNNYSTEEGGAFYVNNGNIQMCLTEMSGNGKNNGSPVTTNGGAIALHNGTFDFAEGSTINNNAAVEKGGALYVSNQSATKITCEGGEYIANEAKLGGGIYASGPITLTFAATIDGNKAWNGGGLYLADGVTMSFGNGLIKSNTANPNTQTADDGAQYGVGGGIYLAQGTLNFTEQNRLGIYNNYASYEAADIYASGESTTINLPNVENMNLTGFDVPGDKLYWVKDFNDQRYEAALLDLKVVIDYLILKFGGRDVWPLTEKQCLDLGYDLVYVKLTPIDLDDNEYAAVTMTYKNKQDKDIVYRKAILKGGSNTSTIVGLPSGNWKFDVTPWSSYKYSDSDSDTSFSPPHKNGFINIQRKLFNGEDNLNNEILITFKKITNSSVDVNKIKQHQFLLPNKMRKGAANNTF